MKIILIELAAENRLKWIVILLLYHEMIFIFLHFVRLNKKDEVMSCHRKSGLAVLCYDDLSPKFLLFDDPHH